MKLTRTLLSAALCLTLILALCPRRTGAAESEPAPVTVEAVALTPAPDAPDGLAHVRLLILGDSMSSYGAADRPVYPSGNVNDQAKMWYSLLDGRLPWVADETEVIALAGAGYSGSAEEPAVFGSVDRVGMQAPDVVILALGMDDPWNAGSAVETGLRAALAQVSEWWPEAAVIVLIPPENDLNGAADRDTARLLFNAAWEDARLAARELGARVIDLRDCFDPGRYALYTIDGLHPNSMGMAAIADFIAESLAE